MTVYSVYEPADDDQDVLARADRIAFVKDGFSWLALLVPALWLLYHRMWLELLAFLAIVAGLQWAFGPERQGLEFAGWVTLALTVLFAFEANDLRGWKLQRRGYRFAGIASGRDRTAAERSFFTVWLPKQEPSTRTSQPAQKQASGDHPPAVPLTRRGEGEDVIGLFPQA